MDALEIWSWRAVRHLGVKPTATMYCLWRSLHFCTVWTLCTMLFYTVNIIQARRSRNDMMKIQGTRSNLAYKMLRAVRKQQGQETCQMCADSVLRNGNHLLMSVGIKGKQCGVTNTGHAGLSVLCVVKSCTSYFAATVSNSML